MTDEQINRLVAEKVMGWTPHATIVRTAIAHAVVEHRFPPAYCTDPAAWAGLLVWLAPYYPRLVCHLKSGDHWAAFLYDDTARIVGHATADAPGRALSLAALRAYGVEVE